MRVHEVTVVEVRFKMDHVQVLILSLLFTFYIVREVELLTALSHLIEEVAHDLAHFFSLALSENGADFSDSCLGRVLIELLGLVQEALFVLGLSPFTTTSSALHEVFCGFSCTELAKLDTSWIEENLGLTLVIATSNLLKVLVVA